MFETIKRFGKTDSHDKPCDTIVGSGSRMKGEIVCKGPSRIAGNIDGELIGDDRILISKEATVTGQIRAAEIEIDGRVTGIITATHRIILNETAIVEGDLQSPSVVIEEGAVFNGKSTMPERVVETATVHALEIKTEKTPTAKAG